MIRKFETKKKPIEPLPGYNIGKILGKNLNF